MIKLERCKRNNLFYQKIRDRHYVPNHGTIGQQIHYLIKVDGNYVGIISAGSATYAVKCRDDFFGINAENRKVALNGIVNNTVFRLEERIPNLGTQVLKLFRESVQKDWYNQYGVKVCGFETFVIEEEWRKGAVYKADNWELVGETAGSTKLHKHGISNLHERVPTEKKLVFCKWVKHGELPTEYMSSWNIGKNVKGQISIEQWIKEEGVKHD